MYRVLLPVLAALVSLPFANPPAFARTMESGDAVAAQKATPAVVNISTWKLRQPTKPGETARRVKTYGSGFIIDSSGIIVTNKHVIDGALEIKVLFNDGDRVPARLVAVAAMLDLAVLKVDVDHPLPVLKWGNSEALQVGDAVLAIGNPLGLGISVSAGIVSALNRDIQDTPFDNYIQTDAAINHGNSGGPLVDLNGEVVGVDTALYNPDEAGGFIGIGLAIPAETAQFIVTRLLDPHSRPGWLGFKLQDLTPELSDALGMRGARGSIIAAIDAGGPAAIGGLRPGDVLSALDGSTPPRLPGVHASDRADPDRPAGGTDRLARCQGGCLQGDRRRMAELHAGWRRDEPADRGGHDPEDAGPGRAAGAADRCRAQAIRPRSEDHRRSDCFRRDRLRGP